MTDRKRCFSIESQSNGELASADKTTRSSYLSPLPIVAGMGSISALVSAFETSPYIVLTILGVAALGIFLYLLRRWRPYDATTL